jgi:hydrogenase maturation protease
MEASGEGTALLEAWKDADCVFLVDAVQSGAAPGTLHRFAAHEAPIPSHYLHCSTHAFGVAEAVELARALNQLPPQLIVYGIEGKDFSAGVGLTAKIRKAAAAAAVQLLEEMRLLAEAEDSAEPPSKTIPQQVQF